MVKSLGQSQSLRKSGRLFQNTKVVEILGKAAAGSRNPFVNQVVCFNKPYNNYKMEGIKMSRNPFVNQVVCFKQIKKQIEKCNERVAIPS